MENTPIYTEKKLFERIAAGDQLAFSQIFEKYFEQIHWRATHLLKSGFWADEIVQEVFVQLWVGRAKLADIENPAAYLFRMAYNRCFDRIRRQESENRVQYLLNQMSEASDTNYQFSGHDYNLLEKLIQEAIDSLPAQGRTVYLLLRQENLTYEEVAEKLTISKNTVRNHMVKNLQHIRSYMQQKIDILFLFWFFLRIF